MRVAGKRFLLQPGLQRRERKVSDAECLRGMSPLMEVHFVLVEGGLQLLLSRHGISFLYEQHDDGEPVQG